MKTQTIPTTSRQAFKILDDMLTEEEKKAALAKSGDDFCEDEHFGLGLWIRNNWIYDQDGESKAMQKLRKQCTLMLAGPAGCKLGPSFLIHPDLISGQFLWRYYKHLKRKYGQQLPAEKP